MTWSKVGETTKAWVEDTAAGGSYAATNAVDGGTGVLEEVFAYLETRGWVISSYNVNSTNPESISYNWKIYKDGLLDTGSTERRGFSFYYTGKTEEGTSDSWAMYHWDESTDTLGDSVFIGQIVYWGGKWAFWQSDEEGESFLILVSDAAHTVVGFQPPAGSVFQVGRYNTNYPSSSGVMPLYEGGGPCYNGDAGSSNRAMHLRFTGGGYVAPTREKLNFTWVTDDYGCPMFHTEGGDISMELDHNRTSMLGPSNTGNITTSVVKYGSNYYMALGSSQRLLFDCGTSPIQF